MCVQDKAKEKTSRFDTLRHSLAGMIRSPKSMLGSSTSVSFVIKISQPVVISLPEAFFFFQKSVSEWQPLFELDKCVFFFHRAAVL